MHIAICDDNVADRKHLERLLSRESDKRMGTPNLLYVDSYGDKEHFLFRPLMYDLVFMDMSETPTLTAEIIDAITEMGFTAPIILYSSKVDYTALPNLPQNVVHQKKPYLPDPLPAFLALGDTHVHGHIETLPLHCADGTKHYAPVHDILYYLSDASSRTIYLKDGTNMAVTDEAWDFQHMAEPFREFYRINNDTVINIRFVTKLTPFTVTMRDGRKFRISPLHHSQMKHIQWLLSQETDPDYSK